MTYCKTHGIRFANGKCRKCEAGAVANHACEECGRAAQVLAFGSYWCVEHYGAAQAAHNYVDWRDVKVQQTVAAHGEWARADGEARSDYHARMMNECRRLSGLAFERMRSPTVAAVNTEPADEEWFIKERM